MKLKTYGVTDYTDYTCQIQAGRATVSVHFTGGAFTQYGVTPAKFETRDPFFQHVIEGSRQYRDGHIQLLGEIDLGREEPKGTHKAEHSVPAAEAKATAALDEGVEEVKVPDKMEAVEWLKEHNPEKGYTAAMLRSKAAFDAACTENGVRFVIGE